MSASEIFKFCRSITCRRDTLHRRVPKISAPLYRCSTPGCSAPAREVSAPEPETPMTMPTEVKVPADLERDARRVAKNDGTYMGAKESKRVIREMKRAPSARGIFSRETLSETKYWRPMKSKLIQTIEKIVDERFKELAPNLSKQDVIDIINGQLGEAPAAAPGGTCPRAPHPGRHGAKCKEAGYRAER